MLYIKLEDGREILVNSRAASMVRLVAVNADRINAIEQGHIAFNFAGAKLKLEIKEVGREITVSIE